MNEERKFEIGEYVEYTNPNGVYIGTKKIVGHELWVGDSYTDHRYYIEPTDTPWYPVSEKCLSRVK